VIDRVNHYTHQNRSAMRRFDLVPVPGRHGPKCNVLRESINCRRIRGYLA
jgi:hypothetical protein